MLIRKHNEQFSVVPREGEFAYLPLPSTTELEHVFTTRYSRKIGSGNTLSFEGERYTFAHPSSLRLDNKTVVEVRKTFKGEVFVWHQGKLLALKKTACPVQLRSQRKKKRQVRFSHTNPPKVIFGGDLGTLNNQHLLRPYEKKHSCFLEILFLVRFTKRSAVGFFHRMKVYKIF